MQNDDINVFHVEDMLNIDFQFKIYKVIGKLVQPNHSHDYIQMWYMKHGECVHHFNGQEHMLSKGSVFVLPPGVWHSMTAINEHTELFGVEFTEAFINEDINVSSRNHMFNYGYIQPFIVSLENIKPTFPLIGNVSKVIEVLLEETLLEFDEKPEHHELFIKANLLKILAIITREYDKSVCEESKAIAERYRAFIVKGLVYIKENYNTKIYLDEVCKITMMSPAYFSYIFKYVTGRTFTEYINHLRIESAKDYLKRSDASMSIIANNIGFCDTASFDRAFKKEVGITPLQYRKNIK